MRIVIDLQGCQTGSTEAMAATLALAQNLARGAGEHQVLVALNGRLQGHTGRLRAAFGDLLPASSVLMYDLPALPEREPASRAWLERVSAELRAGFFATLNPDLVFAPNVADREGLPTVCAASPLAAGYASVLSLSELALAAAPPADPRWRADYERQVAALRSADLLLVAGEDARAQLQAALPDAPVQLLDLNDSAALWDAFAALLARRAPAAQAAAAPARPRLAYVSPLPPEKSGISDYSAELLPQLARYYDIELVADQDHVADGWLKTHLPLRTPDWFEQHAHEFDRVLYHIGNSPLHRHMFGMLQRHPGVVVLHDFYLGHALHAMHHSGYAPDALQNALFASHGFGAVIERDRQGEHAAVWDYPNNKQVLDQAEGVIVHSEYPRRLAVEWYGPDAARDWRVLPLLRGHAEQGDRDAVRAAARKTLGLNADQFMVCSFGMLGPTKLNAKLLEAWLDTPLAGNATCQLVFVGDAGGGAYGHDIAAKLAASPNRERLRITGFVSNAQYQTYLAACDVAVQLRSNTRGETSAAVLDCLLHGVPTVVNAHGSIAELPRDVLVMLDDEFDTAALGAALVRLQGDRALRASMGAAASAYIATEHAPEHVGELYRDALEHFAATSAKRHYRHLLDAVNRVPGVNAPSEADLILAAGAIARNQPSTPPRQLFVDISAMVQTDLKTGIQRVVRSILSALFAAPPAGYRIEPVYTFGRGEQYRYARRHMQRGLQHPVQDLDDAPIEVRAGDMFLGLDLLMHITNQNEDVLMDYRERGCAVYFVVYDLLPVLRPDAFPPGSESGFAAWLHTIAKVSDGLLCISRAVADELAGWIEANPVPRLDRLHLGYFHLGADIDASAPSFGLPAGADQILAQVAARPSLLMVGTVEPRKAHTQALAAFDLLWQQGGDANLVIVGKQGWMMEELAQRMRSHPEAGQRLFWLPGVSDEMLLKLYQASAGLLAASEGEGFGLPLIEAAQYGLPIVARGLPVFREVAGEHAFYFDGTKPADLSNKLAEWLQLLRDGKVPDSTGLRWLTWADSAAQLKQALFGQHWYRELPPAP